MPFPKAYRVSEFAPPPSASARPRHQKTLTAEARAAIADELRKLTRAHQRPLTHDQAIAVATKHSVRVSVVEAIEGNDGYLCGFREGSRSRVPVHYVRAVEVVARIAAELAACGLTRVAIAERLGIPDDDLRAAEAVVANSGGA